MSVMIVTVEVVGKELGTTVKFAHCPKDWLSDVNPTSPNERHFVSSGRETAPPNPVNVPETLTMYSPPDAYVCDFVPGVVYELDDPSPQSMVQFTVPARGISIVVFPSEVSNTSTRKSGLKVT